MTWLLPAMVGLVGLGYLTLFAATTLSKAPKWHAKSRVDVLIGALTAAATLVFVHQYFAWWVVPQALWLLPVAILAAGVAGAILSWPSLPWKRADRTRPRTIAGAVANVVVVAALLLVAL